MIVEQGALEGIRIIDFSHVYQGPVGLQLLADCGADVIKVERPGVGDWSRRWGPYIGDVSAPFASLNRNKRSVAINLKSEAGIEIVLKLLETADVLVHNFRPMVMDRLGLGYDDLVATTDTLEVCGHEVRVLTLQKLIELKRGMTRPKDKLMLIHLEATLEERERMRENE